MVQPSHAEPRSTTLQQVRRIAFWVLGIDFFVMAALGIWLVFRYQPGDSGASTAHAILGLIAVAAALVAAIATVADEDRSTVGILPAVVVLTVIGGLYLTGPTLAWDRLATTEEIEDPRGIGVAFDDRVLALAQGSNEMTPGQYQRIAWLHAGALPIAVIVMGAAGVWATRRRRRYVPQRALPDDAAPATGS